MWLIYLETMFSVLLNFEVFQNIHVLDGMKARILKLGNSELKKIICLEHLQRFNSNQVRSDIPSVQNMNVD